MKTLAPRRPASYIRTFSATPTRTLKFINYLRARLPIVSRSSAENFKDFVAPTYSIEPRLVISSIINIVKLYAVPTRDSVLWRKLR